MSVARHDRRATKRAVALPYARPATSAAASKKRSTWGIGTLFSWLSGRSSSQSPEADEDGENGGMDYDDEEPNTPSQAPKRIIPPPIPVLNSPSNTITNQFFTPPADAPLGQGVGLQPPPKPPVSFQRPQTSVLPTHHQYTAPPPPRRHEPPPVASGSGQQATPPPRLNSASPRKNNAIAAGFLRERGTNMTQTDINVLVALLEQNEEEDSREPFHFEYTTPSPTPLRGTTPAAPPADAPQPNGAASGSTTTTPRRMLSRNPNGDLFWNGGGSARAVRRNHFQSPGFGSGRPAPSSIKLQTRSLTTESKRRRVGEDAASSTARPAETHVANPTAANGPTGTRLGPVVNGAFPISNAPPGVNGTPAKETQAARLRANEKPTAPKFSSPLRQGWTPGSPPSPATPPQAREVRPTRAANVLADLIKEATPPQRRPEVVNPYEQRAGVKLPARTQAKRKAKAKAAAQSKAKAAAAAEEEKKRKEEKAFEELSAQELISATVPKGSKRARPPPNMVKSQSQGSASSEGSEPAGLRRSARLKSPEPSQPPQLPPMRMPAALPNGHGNGSERKRPAVTIEEVSDDEDASPSKKQKRAPSRSSIEVEEVDEAEVATGQASTRPAEVVEPGDQEKGRESSPPVLGKRVKEHGPSKLRYSVPIEEDEDEEKEKERQAQEQKEKERQAQEQKEKERQAQEQKEKERQAQEQKEKERQAQEQKEKERQAQEQKEKERQAQEQKEKERRAQEQKEKERRAQEQKEKERRAREQREKELEAQKEKEKKAAENAKPAVSSAELMPPPPVPRFALAPAAARSSIFGNAPSAPSTSTSVASTSTSVPWPLGPSHSVGAAQMLPIGPTVPPPSTGSMPAPPQDPRSAARDSPVVALPVFRFELAESSTAALNDYERKARQLAKDAPLSSLPTFDWDPDFRPSKPPGGGPSGPGDDSTDDQPPRPPAPATFDWAAAGLAPPTAPANEWTCSMCALPNDNSRTKCGVCDSDR
ncbi:hypothetical protein PUNSTDRAFT_145461 [Punctularia strigosozonata HHB-11173 SS5]|uniref:uncharacterized protein n=1 Tax=Punctularia strigosozonata (strain HHB-11173) TaxID=741275 RepID=UPI0004417AE5|nr:uncharacterized protein PUNSTDRAFT_145461 [Punctularia strigosozonata HHB-11173 SS5]EIN06108.1 hypothetical protein PUNSTDRAFT_145461 [Punctularia strigosozonata HHB-11173 SS5]